MKKTILALLLLTLLFVFVSCGKTLSGRYYVTTQTQDYLIDELLEEYNIRPDDPSIEEYKAAMRERYPMEEVEYYLCSGTDFSVEFKDKEIIFYLSHLDYFTQEYKPDVITLGTYVIEDGKIYVNSERYGFEHTYFGYVKDSVFWYSPEGDESVYPLYQNK